MFVFGVVATKGGVGKTTIAANLGGLLADIGYRVLLIDADVQPSLSRYFSVSHDAEHGLTQMVMAGTLTPDCISQIELPPASLPGEHTLLNAQGGFLHLVKSDTRDGKLQDWLSNRLDRLVRIRMAIKNAALSDSYDVAIIDTQGAVGHLQDAAVNASDLLITPASPDIISAREFVDGTLTLLDRHESAGSRCHWRGRAAPVGDVASARSQSAHQRRCAARCPCRGTWRRGTACSDLCHGRRLQHCARDWTRPRSHVGSHCGRVAERSRCRPGHGHAAGASHANPLARDARQRPRVKAAADACSGGGAAA